MTTVNNYYCNKCSVRIPKHRPRLVCSICKQLKHLRCQYLSRSEATHILNTDTNWICRDCVAEILPVNACTYNNKAGKTNSLGLNTKYNATHVRVSPIRKVIRVFVRGVNLLSMLKVNVIMNH